MLSKRRFSLPCYILLTLSGIKPADGAVAYVVNCCNHASTVSLFATSTGRQTSQWKVDKGAFDVVFSPDGSKAYVSNDVSDSVTVVDVASGSALATIPAGYAIEWMVLSRDGSKLYAESYDYAYESHVVQIDTATNKVSNQLGVAAVLGPMALTPDGKTIYVGSSFSNPTGVLVIDTATLTITTTLPIGVGNGLALTPDGKFLYVPNFGIGPYNPNVAVLDTSSNTVVATVPLDPNLTPGYAQVSPDGSKAWVAEFPYLSAASVIAVIDTATNQITNKISLPGGASPGATVFSPDGRRAYVTNFSSSVYVVDVAGMKVVGRIDSLGVVNGPAVSPSGTILAVPNTETSRAAAFDQATGAQLANIPVGAMLWGSQLYLEYGGAAVSADGSRAYVTNYASNNVSVIDTATKRVLKSVGVGAFPVGVALAPDGSKAYVANSYSNSVTVINTETFITKEVSMPHNTYPSSITITPDGRRVYVAGNNPIPDFGTAKCYIFVIDAISSHVVASIPILYPMAVAASPDGAKVYAVGGSTSIYTISTATNTITGAVKLENGGPIQPVTSGIAVTPDGSKVFADDGSGNRVYEVNAVQNKLVRTITAGLVSGMMAISPEGSELWVGDYMGEALTVVDVASGGVMKTMPLGNQSYGIAFGPR